MENKMQEEEMPSYKNQSCKDHPHPRKIKFVINGTEKLILRGKCFSHLEKWILYNAMDTETGELFVIKEWNMYDLDEGMIKKTEQQLRSLISLKHDNLAKLIGYSYEYIKLEKKWVCYILQEFVLGLNCLTPFVKENLVLRMNSLRHISREILKGFEFLEKNGMKYVKLHDSSIYLDSNGIVKLVNYEIEELEGNLITPADIENTKIYNLGILLLTLNGEETNEAEFIEITKSVYTGYQNFITMCINDQDNNQLTATKLLNHSFILDLQEQFNTNVEMLKCVDVLNKAEVPERRQSTEQEPLAIDSEMSECGDASTKIEVLERSLSRVEKEFETLELLGQGGFGKVFKVKQKLDGAIYALKKVKLNPSDEKLNRKIIREVETLSRMNHENIVRYCYSWIDDADTSDSDSDETDSSDCKDSYKDQMALSKYDGEVYMESSTSELNDYTDDFITFADINDQIDGDSKVSEKQSTHDTSLIKQNLKRILFIQMEFCEKKTLKTVISCGELYGDQKRIWKFIREIVEGLAHIHGNGIIHRDLNPTNIFLDSKDRVKIGDFGLATTNLRYKLKILNRQNDETDASVSKLTSGSYTDQVGTVYYKAPELNIISRIYYDKKVDMYSLGIIIFEMCYPHPSTDSERDRILTNLRSKGISFPVDFKLGTYEKQCEIIRKLLNHDVEARPTSEQLLQLKLIPPIIEENKQEEMFKHVIEDPNSNPRLYRYLMNCCIRQNTKRYHNLNYGFENVSKLDFVKDIVIRILKVHGGQNLSMSRLMPQNITCFNNICGSCVQLMNGAGEIASMPCNIRMPFIWYIAENPYLAWFRRFSVERVPLGHLNDTYECAFDVITPVDLHKSNNFLIDAEMLRILNRIHESLYYLDHKSATINLNHRLLIQAICKECILKEYYTNIIKLPISLRSLKNAKGPSKNILLKMFIPETHEKLCKLLDRSYSLKKFRSMLHNFFTNREALNMAETAMKELERIVATNDSLGVSVNIKINPGFLHRYEQYSGVLIGFTYTFGRTTYLLGAGGRYDTIIQNIQSELNIIENSSRYGIGISIYLENLCKVVELENRKLPYHPYFNVVVCSFYKKHGMQKEIKEVLRRFWLSEIPCYFIKPHNKKHLVSFCKKNNVQFAVTLYSKDMNKQENVTIMDGTDDWITSLELPMSLEDAITYLRSAIRRHQNSLSMLSMDIPLISVCDEELSNPFARFTYESDLRRKTAIYKNRLPGKTLIIVVDIELGIVVKAMMFMSFNIHYQTTLDSVCMRYPEHSRMFKAICGEIYCHTRLYKELNVIFYNKLDGLVYVYCL